MKIKEMILPILFFFTILSLIIMNVNEKLTLLNNTEIVIGDTEIVTCINNKITNGEFKLDEDILPFEFFDSDNITIQCGRLLDKENYLYSGVILYLNNDKINLTKEESINIRKAIENEKEDLNDNIRYELLKTCK